MRILAIGALALSLALAGCSDGAASDSAKPPKSVPDSALPGLLLSAKDVDTAMGVTGMTPQNPVDVMGDHRNLLSNLNCLGVWQVNEAPIYDPSHYKTLRQQMLRTPNTDQWDSLVVQSAVTYRTADAARAFFDDSADRWSKCTNHTINIRVNGQALPKWVSGNLAKTDTLLSMPYTRGADSQTRSCQRALALAANVILDIQACKPAQQEPISAAVDIADRIESKMPR
ncbi:sensor domain-containing protein [Mycolicibacterium fluoranthenivorans]|uniref:Serine/threonine-protein kinase n=1 Tax=Mycolicibacterium fluoranthenivorans TaxID=258505 RepID=A0A7X5ZBQ0_9MYCO|nr:sensor domain-containing protein [Mycolicibacterium fluoranthenivorans]MCV7357010.1 sensor domain-containing protein [Mycolicibacterium fluoranthenivorans]NIH94407.1 serine/threonine-protein kinase [Mycolicibacterium fluoranthenivorans]